MDAVVWVGSVLLTGVLTGVLGNLATDALKTMWRRISRGDGK